jgi:glycosyltransferase involved in cell wall biosynthesis
MLGNLLQSFSDMKLPFGVAVEFVIVENNDALTLAQIIEDNLPGQVVHYELEPILGISAARNHVLEISLRNDFNLTTFIDDDQVVAEDWLEKLVARQQSGDLDLTGGPQLVQPIPKQVSLLKRMIGKKLEVIRLGNIQKADKKFEEGTDHQVVLYTNNWMVKNEFLKKTGLRFDEELGFSGGEDAAFFYEVRENGGTTGWAPNSLTYEELPPSRLSLGYQYCRARDQTTQSFNPSARKASIFFSIKTIISCFVKILRAVLLGLLIIPTGGATLLKSVQIFGIAMGRLRGLLGKKSNHYQTVQGN